MTHFFIASVYRCFRTRKRVRGNRKKTYTYKNKLSYNVNVRLRRCNNTIRVKRSVCDDEFDFELNSNIGKMEKGYTT